MIESGYGDKGQIRNAFEYRPDKLGAVRAPQENIDDGEVETGFFERLQCGSALAASTISKWLTRSTKPIIARTSDWSSTTRTRGMNIPVASSPPTYAEISDLVVEQAAILNHSVKRRLRLATGNAMFAIARLGSAVLLVAKPCRKSELARMVRTTLGS